MSTSKKFGWALLGLHFGLLLGSVLAGVGEQRPAYEVGWAHVFAVFAVVLPPALYGYLIALDD